MGPRPFRATPFSPRCTKEVFEEALFARRRDLFSQLDLGFFDTTSICIVADRGMISKDTLQQLQADERKVHLDSVASTRVDGWGH